MALATAILVAVCVRGLAALSCSPEGCDEAFCNDIMLAGSDWITRPTSKLRLVCDGSDGGGWTVIQQRLDGRESFDRKWVEYKNGFGIVDRHSEFWIGLLTMHDLTNEHRMELRIDVSHGNRTMAIEYDHFFVGNEPLSFRLTLGSVTLMTATTDTLALSKGVSFSTSDNDPYHKKCASTVHPRSGGWWWARDSESSDACNSTNLNGLYGPRQGWAGVVWSGFAGSDGLTKTKMRIRPAGFQKRSFCQVACYPGEECVRDSIVDKTYSCVATTFGGFPAEEKEGEREGLYALDIVILGVLSLLTVILVTTGLDLVFTSMREKAESELNAADRVKADMSEFTLERLMLGGRVSAKEGVANIQTAATNVASNVTDTFGNLVTQLDIKKMAANPFEKMAANPFEKMATDMWYRPPSPTQGRRPEMARTPPIERPLGSSSSEDI